MKPTRQHYDQVDPYVTRDGSTIRELMHPDHHSVANQSLAEATVEPHSQTQLHKHEVSEELYYIVSGEGIMTLDEDKFSVTAGDVIRIAPGKAHKIANLQDTPLKILCCCSPAYSHQDTIILDT